MNKNKKLFTTILHKIGPLKTIETTIAAFSTLNKVNDYFLNKAENLEKKEAYTLNSQNQLAYAFTEDEMQDYQITYARCKVMLKLFEFTLEAYEQDILDEFGPEMGTTFKETQKNMQMVLSLGKRWVMGSLNQTLRPDFELSVIEALLTQE